MDFSSADRVLESLQRRNPPLEDTVIDVSKRLLSLPHGEDSEDVASSAQVVLDGTLVLLGSDSIAPGAASAARWEGLAVGLYIATELLQHPLQIKDAIYVEGPRVPSIKENASSDEGIFPETASMVGSTATTPWWLATAAKNLAVESQMKLAQQLLQKCAQHLEHTEPRVRTLVAKAVGAVVAYRRYQQQGDGLNTTQMTELEAASHDLHRRILASLREHIQRGRTDGDDKFSKSSTGALDDTTGWRALETNWQGLAAYIAACGGHYFAEHELTDLLLQDVDYCATQHLNRHVRAAAMNVLEQMIHAAAAAAVLDDADAAPLRLIASPESMLRKTIVNVIKFGLADNWSQVRMAASVLCRVFWTVLLRERDHDENTMVVEDLYPVIMPAMCLNRFYLAQGVKLYSHETWHMVFAKPGSGLDCVAAHAGAVCRYYAQMADADNHAVREAACQAIAELATKLGSDPQYRAFLQPHVTLMLQSLLMCFHDESWPVRDEACLACGIFCRAYPEEAKSELPTLWQRWTEQLTDTIWSVREDAAVALGDALMAYPDELYPKIMDLLRTNIPSARNQPNMTMEQYKQRHNDIDAHTDAQLYSCGSLAPKLRKGGAGRIGCSSCADDRAKSPWEATDGCIYLLRELCLISAKAEKPPQLDLSDAVLVPLLTELADVCRVQHFPQSHDLRSTLWRQLTPMAYALGKDRFKRVYLDLFLELLLSNLESSTASPLSKHSAGQCAEELANLVGPMIFRGRLADDDQRRVFDRVMEERQREQQMIGGAAKFESPFGPSGLLDRVGGKVMMPTASS